MSWVSVPMSPVLKASYARRMVATLSSALIVMDSFCRDPVETPRRLDLVAPPRDRSTTVLLGSGPAGFPCVRGGGAGPGGRRDDLSRGRARLCPPRRPLTVAPAGQCRPPCPRIPE